MLDPVLDLISEELMAFGRKQAEVPGEGMFANTSYAIDTFTSLEVVIDKTLRRHKYPTWFFIVPLDCVPNVVRVMQDSVTASLMVPKRYPLINMLRSKHGIVVTYFTFVIDEGTDGTTVAETRYFPIVVLNIESESVIRLTPGHYADHGDANTYLEHLINWLSELQVLSAFVEPLEHGKLQHPLV